jgi:hypothetical protein
MRLSPNHDLDVLVERCNQVHEALDGEARELVVPKRRDFQLRYSQHLGCAGLRELAFFEHLINGIGQADLAGRSAASGNPRSAKMLAVPRVTPRPRPAFLICVDSAILNHNSGRIMPYMA